MKYERIAVVTFLLFTCAVNAQEVRFVSVIGSWGGLGTPAKSEIRIHSSLARPGEKGPSVSPIALARLVSALQEPSLSKPSASNLGIDAAWLQNHVGMAGRNASMLWFDQGTPAQKQFFRQKFTDVSTLQSRLNNVYGGSHTDDYPGMRIEVHLEDGNTITASTDSQNPLMLPWCVSTGNATCTKTYNAHVSEALYDLLPKKFTNRERLRDGDSLGDLAPQMGLYMSSALEKEWNMIGVQGKDATSLAKLHQHFTIRYADINTYNDLAFNEVPNEGKTVDENLQVILWRPGDPPHFTIEAHLLREHGETLGVDEVFDKANRYANAALAVPWLAAFLRAHPEEHASVAYVHGRSMTDKAMEIFARDMRAGSHEPLVERVRVSQSEDVLLVTGSGDWWIVLPDHSMILWRWASLHPILKWPMNTFSANECTDYRQVTGGCDGSLISPVGEIMH